MFIFPLDNPVPFFRMERDNEVHKQLTNGKTVNAIKQTEERGLKALAILIASGKLNRAELEDVAFDLYEKQYLQALRDAEQLVIPWSMGDYPSNGIANVWQGNTLQPLADCFNCHSPLLNGVCQRCEGDFDAYTREVCNCNGPITLEKLATMEANAFCDSIRDASRV